MLLTLYCCYLHCTSGRLIMSLKYLGRSGNEVHPAYHDGLATSLRPAVEFSCILNWITVKVCSMNMGPLHFASQQYMPSGYSDSTDAVVASIGVLCIGAFHQAVSPEPLHYWRRQGTPYTLLDTKIVSVEGWAGYLIFVSKQAVQKSICHDNVPNKYTAGKSRSNVIYFFGKRENSKIIWRNSLW